MVEDVTEASKGGYALLDAGTARVIDGDDGRSHFESEFLNFHDFVSRRASERATVNGEVERVNEDESSVNFAVARYDAVAKEDILVHAEVVASVRDKLVDFDEGAFVKKHVNAFTSGLFTFLVLLVDARLTASQFRLSVEFYELLLCVVHVIWK